jgi:hypothetical protein
VRFACYGIAKDGFRCMGMVRLLLRERGMHGQSGRESAAGAKQNIAS